MFYEWLKVWICTCVYLYFIILDSYKSNLNSPFYIPSDLNLNSNGLCICIYMLIKFINSSSHKKYKGIKFKKRNISSLIKKNYF